MSFCVHFSRMPTIQMRGRRHVAPAIVTSWFRLCGSLHAIHAGPTTTAKRTYLSIACSNSNMMTTCHGCMVKPTGSYYTGSNRDWGGRIKPAARFAAPSRGVFTSPEQLYDVVWTVAAVKAIIASSAIVYFNFVTGVIWYTATSMSHKHISKDGHVLLVDMYNYRFGKTHYELGDIVCYDAGKTKGDISRIVAIPGETVLLPVSKQAEDRVVVPADHFYLCPDSTLQGAGIYHQRALRGRVKARSFLSINQSRQLPLSEIAKYMLVWVPLPVKATEQINRDLTIVRAAPPRKG
jgi:hypothetical protein